MRRPQSAPATPRWPVSVTLLIALVTGLPSPTRADVISFEAVLHGVQEVPAVATDARGLGTIVFDTATRRLDWLIVHDVASPSAAHFHGPAFPGTSAGIRIDIGAVSGLASPLAGTATVDATDVPDLLAGRWYVNVHSPSFPGGQVRGQLAPRSRSAPVSIFPPSGALGQHQGIDVGISVVPPAGETVTGGRMRLDGADVTPAFLACLRTTTPAGGALLLLCDVPAGGLAPGEHVLDARLEFSGGGAAGSTAVWNVRPDAP